MVRQPGSRRPFKTRQVRPGLPHTSRSVHSGQLNAQCTVRGKGDGQISPLCLTNTADSHLRVILRDRILSSTPAGSPRWMTVARRGRLFLLCVFLIDSLLLGY